MTPLYYTDSTIWNVELETVYEIFWLDANEPRSGSGDKVIKIFYKFPVSAVQSYFICSIWSEETKSKTNGKYILKRNMKSFSNETLNFFFRKFCFSYFLDLAKTVWALRILSQNSVIKELWALENHVLVNMLLYSSDYSFTEVTLSIHWYIAQNVLTTFSMQVHLDALLRLPSLVVLRLPSLAYS